MYRSIDLTASRYAAMMLEHTAAGIAVYDAQNLRLLEANERYLQMIRPLLSNGEESDGPIEHTVFELENHVETQAVVDIFRSVAETGISYQIDEFASPSPRHGTTYWNWALHPVRDCSDSVTHLVLTVRDVTQQVQARLQAQKAQEELHQTNQAVIKDRERLEQQKNDFFSIAHHELRTPITIIQGFAEILQLKTGQEQTLDPLTHYSLTSITEQSLHLSHLVEEMLDISRIGQGQFILKREHHDLTRLLKRIVEQQAVAGCDHHLHLVLEGLPEEERLMAFIDEERMTQVLNNLISNAIKYSPLHSAIEVGLRFAQERPYEALLWVRDEGIGIAEEEIPHIFERFHRGRNASRAQSGFGIGLYLAKEVITRHQGHIWVESREGQGSTFSMILPLS